MSNLISTAKENLSFVLACVIVVAVILIIALLAEKLIHKNRKRAAAVFCTAVL